MIKITLKIYLHFKVVVKIIFFYLYCLYIKTSIYLFKRIFILID